MPIAVSSSAIAAKSPGEHRRRASREQALVDPCVHRLQVVDGQLGVQTAHDALHRGAERTPATRSCAPRRTGCCRTARCRDSRRRQARLRRSAPPASRRRRRRRSCTPRCPGLPRTRGTRAGRARLRAGSSSGRSPRPRRSRAPARARRTMSGSVRRATRNAASPRSSRRRSRTCRCACGDSPGASGRPLIVAALLLLLPLKGTLVATPAAATPGWRLTASIRRSTNASRRGPSGYRFQGSAIWPLRMLSGRKPGATSITCFRLNASRPAPASSTKASATCATRNPWRRRCAARLAVVVRVSDVSELVAWLRRLYQAIGTPMATPITRALVTATTAARAVERDVRAERKAIGAEQRQQPDAASADGQSEKAADRGQKRRLDQDLGHDVPPARADRLPHGQLLHAAAGADQQQVGHVDGADEQQEEHARLQEQQRGPDLGDLGRVQRHHDRSEAGVGHELRLRVGQPPSPRCGRRSATAPPRARRRAEAARSCATSCRSGVARGRAPAGPMRAAGTGSASRRGS